MSEGEAVKRMDSTHPSHESRARKGGLWRKKVINPNISSSINKYWIFSLGQKSRADVCRHVGAQPLREGWQVSISWRLQVPLTFR